jgi:hypothetical protein
VHGRQAVALSGVVFHEGVSADDLTSTDLLAVALGGQGLNKDSMVELQGLEPWTFCMPCRRSSQLSYSPKFYK